MTVRSDCGTENGTVAGTQCFFRSDGRDIFAGEKSHIYGSSHSNQRIEGWWSFLRRHWWIDFFKDMVASNVLFLGNDLNMACLWFCFAHLIQADLEKVKEQWNSHYIRKSRFDTIAGIPDILYFLPESVGKSDCLIPVNNQQIEAMEVNCQLNEPAENLYLEYYEHILTEMDLQSPSNEEEAAHFFQLLMNLQG